VDGTAFSATEITKLGSDYLTIGYYARVWTRDVDAEAEEIDPNFAYGGMISANVKWTLVYIDDAKTQMKLTITGNGKMRDFGTGGAPWYGYRDQIVEIEVEEGITYIGRCAFYNLTKVNKVTLYEGLEGIGDYAFNRCSALSKIEIPTTVTSIGTGAFKKTGLVVIPTV